MKKLLFLCIFLFLSSIIFAQGRLDGLWEGEITYGGLDSPQSYRFQLWLEVKDQYITGRSYVFLNQEEVIEMEVKGRMYGDLSVYLQEVEFVPIAGSEVIPGFYRKYQFSYNRSIWETALEGYWQESYQENRTGKVQLGRLKLQRVKTMKP